MITGYNTSNTSRHTTKAMNKHPWIEDNTTLEQEGIQVITKHQGMPAVKVDTVLVPKTRLEGMIVKTYDTNQIG